MNKLSFNEVENINNKAQKVIENTVLNKYTTIIFDLDGVMWDCFSSKGDSIGAFQTEPPFRLQDENVIFDLGGNIIQLQKGMIDIIELLDSMDRNLGICSRSADSDKDLPFAAQPAVMLLKKFGLYKYFNFDIIIKPNISKVNYVHSFGKTLFIDDSKDNIEEVSKKDDVDVLWRKSFNEWPDLLTKIY